MSKIISVKFFAVHTVGGGLKNSYNKNVVNRISIKEAIFGALKEYTVDESRVRKKTCLKALLLSALDLRSTS